jgi:hypothetical protein
MHLYFISWPSVHLLLTFSSTSVHLQLIFSFLHLTSSPSVFIYLTFRWPLLDFKLAFSPFLALFTFTWASVDLDLALSSPGYLQMTFSLLSVDLRLTFKLSSAHRRVSVSWPQLADLDSTLTSHSDDLQFFCSLSVDLLSFSSSADFQITFNWTWDDLQLILISFSWPSRDVQDTFSWPSSHLQLTTSWPLVHFPFTWPSVELWMTFSSPRPSVNL